MQLVYFSRIREQIGINEETFELPEGIHTVEHLIESLTKRGEPFTSALAKDALIKVAVNQVHTPLTHPVTNTDEVAFFPPVTGG